MDGVAIFSTAFVIREKRVCCILVLFDMGKVCQAERGSQDLRTRRLFLETEVGDLFDELVACSGFEVEGVGLEEVFGV